MTLEYKAAVAPNIPAAEEHLNRMAEDGWVLAEIFPTSELGMTNKICVITEREKQDAEEGI